MNNNQYNGYNQNNDFNNNNYPNNQYNNMNNNYYPNNQSNNYPNNQFNQNNDFNNYQNNMQYNQQQYNPNYNQQYNQPQYNQDYNQQYNQNYQYHESYNTDKEPDGSGFGGFLGTIVGVVALIALCYLGFYLVTSYFDSNKSVVCTANGAGYDIKYEFTVNNKKKEIKTMGISYVINYNDGLTKREKNVLNELFFMGASAGEYGNYTGVTYTYNGPTSTSLSRLSSEIEEYKDKDVSFDFKIVRKKVTNKNVLAMFEEFDGKEAYELVNYLSDSSNNPYGLTCYEK